MKEPGLTRCFRHGSGIAANHRASASLRFDNRPAESFEARWVNQGDSEVVKPLERFTAGIGHLHDAIKDSETFRERRRVVVQRLAGKYHSVLSTDPCSGQKYASTPSRFFRRKFEPTCSANGILGSKPGIEDTGPGLLVRQLTVIEIQAQQDHVDLGTRFFFLCNQTPGIVGGRGGIANHSVCLFQSSQDPALQEPAGD